ncbi:MAG: GDSL-type esterase/lipase family protein [Sulfurimonas sp.]|nr:GDSL-type esterase/lipase family protein [Sulfurimonas sp.]
MSKTSLVAIITLVIILIGVGIKENSSKATNIVLKENSLILAFGDSLTRGFGTESEFSYPQQLHKKTGLEVINSGVNGELSSEGLERLPMLLKHKPDIVILCHGGNDILNKLPSLQLKINLLAMIKMIQESGAQVLLVGVPNFGLFGFDVHEVYEELAGETDILFEDKILTKIEKDNSLKSDYVHPNAKGYEMMADAFIEILQIQNN